MPIVKLNTIKIQNKNAISIPLPCGDCPCCYWADRHGGPNSPLREYSLGKERYCPDTVIAFEELREKYPDQTFLIRK